MYRQRGPGDQGSDSKQKALKGKIPPVEYIEEEEEIGLIDLKLYAVLRNINCPFNCIK